MKALYLLAVALAAAEGPLPSQPPAGLPDACPGATEAVEGVPMPFGRFTPVKGDWVAYSLRGSNVNLPAVIRFEIVERARAAGEDAYWMEISMGDGVLALFRVKMLFTGNPNNPVNIKRKYFALGAGEYEEVPKETGEGSGSETEQPAAGSGHAASCGQWRTVRGRTQVKTPAGKFEVERVELVAKDGTTAFRASLNDTVPLFKLVAIEVQGGVVMELLDYKRPEKARTPQAPNESSQ